jgi:hypothetical protein
VRAAWSRSSGEAALAYATLGFSVLPLRGKVPALKSWKPYQTAPAPLEVVERWARAGLLRNVGLVCGAGSGGLVVLDLDGEAAYAAFAARFPRLISTYTVATGSGYGRHLYFLCARPPPSTRALHTPLGNVELCSGGRQVAAPPSVHPDTGRPYTVWLPLDLLRVPDLDLVRSWIATLRPKQNPICQQKGLPMDPEKRAAPHLVEAVTAYFLALGYRRNGDWLNGPCVHPERHQHHDAKPSFGYNIRTGYGHCFVCGVLSEKDIAAALDMSGW